MKKLVLFALVAGFALAENSFSPKLLEIVDAYDAEDYKKAFELASKLCDDEKASKTYRAVGCGFVAGIYQNGKVVKQDDEKWLNFIKKLAI
ncbi:hypothetical protein [Campylobacter sp. 19-13652]|uniref:hypothetical protein n=1 Tax=Campylobacter sp. 19-13652 TaxID=2840180 RepID=UPI001C78B81F|nr:hypothetical protein [Campylobacter sp. 19-13652]BCX80121.1 hypothetical protein LBC_15830 [Campylobacter sp. 19-13652]BCX80130.1 hypothetical protein LBC_15920 [Campylobacter sp. 19-13652]